MPTSNDSPDANADSTVDSREARSRGSRGRRTVPWAPIIVALALLVVAGLLFAFLRPGAAGPVGGGEENQAQNQAGAGASPGDCRERTTVAVSVPENIAPVVQAAADRAGGEACADYQLSSVAPDAALAALRSNEQRPNLWVADSQVHVERALSQNPELGMTAGEPFAVSPVVTAMTKERAEQISGRTTWKYYFDNVQDVRLNDPMHDTASLHALFSGVPRGTEKAPDPASGKSAAGPGGGPMNAVLLEAANPGTVRYDALPSDAAEAGTSMFAVSEQEFARYTKAHENPALVAMPPAEGSVPLEYRAVTLPTTDAATATASQALVAELAADETIEAVRQADFRAPGDEGGPSLPGKNGDEQFAAVAMPTPQAEEIRGIISQWQSISSGLRLLLAIDTSGSMLRADGPSGMSRLQLASQFAVRGSALLPPNTEVGVWEFSTAPDKKGNWREVLPVGPLADEGGNQAQRSRLSTGFRSIAAAVGGDTPLYDTILDAVLTMRENFDPKRINVAVVITDGTNDASDSMNLSGLLKTLEQMTVPGEEVHVATVAIGEDADQEPLKKIAEATDGAFYYLERVEDIEDMMLSGLLDFAPSAKPGDPLP